MATSRRDLGRGLRAGRRASTRRPRRGPAPVSLARALSKLAICSRAEACRLVAAGRVCVNGRVVRQPAARIDFSADRIAIDGQRARRPRLRTVIALHKPAGYITTRTDPGGRPTVYALLDGLDRWVFPVGRLDRDTSGLLILTDDHRLGHALSDPSAHVGKVYHARVRGVPPVEALVALRQGVALRDGTLTRPARVRTLGVNRDGSTWLELTLTEGRNRQVRQMCAAVGHDVVQLVRVRVGRLGLGDLRPGAWRRLTEREVDRLVGARLARPRATRSPGRS